MPLDLQELSPKPKLEALDAPRIPRLTARTNASPVIASAVPITITPPAGSDAGSKESLRWSDEKTIIPPTPTTPHTVIAPWDDTKSGLEARTASAKSEKSLTSDTNDRTSSDTAKQPFRHEVNLPSLILN
jgi:hypothetical protein